MLAALKTLRTLAAYALCALLFIAPFTVLSAIALTGNTWAFNSLHSMDIAICSMCHGTKLESISARSFRLSHDKRYRYQMLVIDFLARPFDGDNHCRRAHKWESKVIKIR